jgi:hypothetical protein
MTLFFGWERMFAAEVFVDGRSCQVGSNTASAMSK